MKRLILLAAMVTFCLKSKAQSDTTKSSVWAYSSKTNEMTADQSFYAGLYNILPSDYDVRILVRYKQKKNEVLLLIDKGLFDFVGATYKIQAKFDSEDIEGYWCDKSADNEFSTLFIRNQSKFIKKLKSSKHLYLQAHIYGRGDQVFQFSTENLKWDH